MQLAHLNYTFTSMGDGLGEVRQYDHGQCRERRSHVGIHTEALLHYTGRPIPAELADLLDLAVAVTVADRLTVRRADTAALIEIALPVRRPDLFNGDRIAAIENLLYWYTHDQWQLTFTPHMGLRRIAEQQLGLVPSQTNQALEVSLWSGGLDSLAGLYNRLRSTTTTAHLLVGTGGNRIMHATQRKAYAALHRLFPGRLTLLQLPLRRVDTARYAERSRTQRSRGFVFLLLGAICAMLAGQQVLDVYENGIGAMNLSFRASEVGLDHSRTVHPWSLQQMSTLLSNLLGRSFRIRNQFYFWTKAEMCRALHEDGRTPLVATTLSCDQLRRSPGLQCGTCSSCLLRRQALAAAGMLDPSQYVVSRGQAISVHHRGPTSQHFSAMLDQVATFQHLFAVPAPWPHVARMYPEAADIVDRLTDSPTAAKQMAADLLGMYQRYTQEWLAVKQELTSMMCNTMVVPTTNEASRPTERKLG